MRKFFTLKGTIEKPWQMKKYENLLWFIFALLIALVLCLALSSCNVTRTVTTTAQTVQRGDTTTVVMTKTIEQYDAKADVTKLLQAR